MSDEDKLEGRKAALAIVQKINKNKPEPAEPVSFDDLTQAIDRLAESRPDMSEPLAASGGRLAAHRRIHRECQRPDRLGWLVP